MKRLKDITKEQAIEIAKMIWGFDEFIKSKPTFTYFNGNYGDYTEKESEDITVTFDFDTFPEKKIGKMFVCIYPNLDCNIAEFDFIPSENPKNENSKGYWSHKRSYPVRNQNAVQKKFIEWGIEPTAFGVNNHIIKNNIYESNQLQNDLWVEANRLFNLKEHTQDGRDLQMKNFIIIKK